MIRKKDVDEKTFMSSLNSWAERINKKETLTFKTQ
jgi:hypothetical protein